MTRSEADPSRTRFVRGVWRALIRAVGLGVFVSVLPCASAVAWAQAATPDSEAIQRLKSEIEKRTLELELQSLEIKYLTALLPFSNATAPSPAVVLHDTLGVELRVQADRGLRALAASMAGELRPLIGAATVVMFSEKEVEGIARLRACMEHADWLNRQCRLVLDEPGRPAISGLTALNLPSVADLVVKSIGGILRLFGREVTLSASKLSLRPDALEYLVLHELQGVKVVVPKYVTGWTSADEPGSLLGALNGLLAVSAELCGRAARMESGRGEEARKLLALADTLRGFVGDLKRIDRQGESLLGQLLRSEAVWRHFETAPGAVWLVIESTEACGGIRSEKRALSSGKVEFSALVGGRYALFRPDGTLVGMNAMQCVTPYQRADGIVGRGR